MGLYPPSPFTGRPLGKTLPALKESSLLIDVPSGHTYATFGYEHFYSSQAWREAVKILPKCHPTQGPWIAGGAIRRLLLDDWTPGAGDIDYFCKDQQQHHLTCARLEGLDAPLIQETKDHITYTYDGMKIQVIRSRFCQTLEEHLDNFDFQICQTGWDGERFMVSVQAFKDLLTKELNVTGVFHNPVGSLLRLIKYYRQGFTPTPQCIHALLEAAKDHADTHGWYMSV